MKENAFSLKIVTLLITTLKTQLLFLFLIELCDQESVSQIFPTPDLLIYAYITSLKPHCPPLSPGSPVAFEAYNRKATNLLPQSEMTLKLEGGRRRGEKKKSSHSMSFEKVFAPLRTPPITVLF